MGRGRAKAKQTKVARELKYREFNTDFTELQRELHGDVESDGSPDTDRDGLADDDDPYADLYREPRRVADLAPVTRDRSVAQPDPA